MAPTLPIYTSLPTLKLPVRHMCTPSHSTLHTIITLLLTLHPHTVYSKPFRYTRPLHFSCFFFTRLRHTYTSPPHKTFPHERSPRSPFTTPHRPHISPTIHTSSGHKAPHACHTHTPPSTKTHWLPAPRVPLLPLTIVMRTSSTESPTHLLQNSSTQKIPAYFHCNLQKHSSHRHFPDTHVLIHTWCPPNCTLLPHSPYYTTYPLPSCAYLSSHRCRRLTRHLWRTPHTHTTHIPHTHTNAPKLPKVLTQVLLAPLAPLTHSPCCLLTLLTLTLPQEQIN